MKRLRFLNFFNMQNLRKSINYVREHGFSAFLRKVIQKLQTAMLGGTEHWDLFGTRAFVANKYLRGDGIEIGALHQPLVVPKTANVKYLDMWTADDLRKQYPELESYHIVDVDIIDNGEKLDTIESSSQDFVIANHMLEHSQNPIEALGNMLRVLKDGGILYLAVPDKRYTFDKERPVTPTEHIIKDFKEGPSWSKRQHYEEWVRLVDRIHDEIEAEKKVTRLIDADGHIHYHVWTQAEILDMLLTAKKDFKLGFEIELFMKNEIEVIAAMRKTQ